MTLLNALRELTVGLESVQPSLFAFSVAPLLRFGLIADDGELTDKGRYFYGHLKALEAAGVGPQDLLPLVGKAPELLLARAGRSESTLLGLTATGHLVAAGHLTATGQSVLHDLELLADLLGAPLA